MKRTALAVVLLLGFGCSVSVDKLVKHGIALRDSGKYEEAIIQFQEALKTKPKHAEANFEMGLTLYKKYDCGNAIPYLQNAAKYGYNELKTHIALGNSYQMCGMGQEAIIEYQLALELLPKSPELHTLLADAYLQRSGSAGLAQTEYTTALEQDTAFVPAIVGMGNYYKYLRQTDQAIAQYEKAKVINPRYALTYMQLGLVWIEKKEYDKALTELGKYITLAPRDPKGYAKVAEIYERTKDYDNAIKYMQYAIAYGDTSTNALRVMSFLYNRSKRFPENKEVLKKILERAPDDMNIWMELAKMYALTDSARLAIDAYNRVLGLDPSKLSPLSFTLGLAYYTIAKYDSAVIMFTTKIELDSLAAGAYINRALAYIQLNKYEKARADLEKGIKIQPNHIQAHLWLGGIYAYQNLKAKARAEFNTVLKLDPGNKDAKKALRDLAAVAPPPVEDYRDYVDTEIWTSGDTLQP